MACICGTAGCLWSGNGSFCKILNKAGVPLDGKWPLLVLCLREIGVDRILSEPQKAAIQKLLVDTLRERDFSEENYVRTSSAIREVLTAPYEQKLLALTREAAALTEEAHRILGRHTQEVLSVAEGMDSDLVEGSDPSAVLSGLRDALHSVAEKMQQDMNVLIDLSHKDCLTGLANRRSFDAFLNEVEREWVSDGVPASLIMLDVDYFKSFNDTYGHLVGDQVLRTLASLVRQFSELPGDNTRSLAARYGGEEFAIIIQGEAALGVVELAENLRRAIKNASLLLRDANNVIVETGIHVTASFGVASIWKGWKSAFAANLIDCADKALYHAKKNGRNCTVRYAPESRQIYELVDAEDMGASQPVSHGRKGSEHAT